MSVEEYRKSPESGIAVVLDNVRSAHNVGSAFRSSDSFKVDRICLCGICAVPPSAEIHKSAIGAEFSVPWEHFDRTIDAIRRRWTTFLRKKAVSMPSFSETRCREWTRRSSMPPISHLKYLSTGPNIR